MKRFKVIFFSLILALAFSSCEKVETAELIEDHAVEEELIFQFKSLEREISERLNSEDFEKEIEKFESGKRSAVEFLAEIGIDQKTLNKRLLTMEENVNSLGCSPDLERVRQSITAAFEKDIVTSRHLGTPCYDAYQEGMIEAALQFGVCSVVSAESLLGPFLACATSYTVTVTIKRRAFFRCLDENY